MIPKDIVDNIFETARIEEVVGDFVTLKKKANMLGVCPFHDEKKHLLSRFLLPRNLQMLWLWRRRKLCKLYYGTRAVFLSRSTEVSS